MKNYSRIEKEAKKFILEYKLFYFFIIEADMEINFHMQDIIRLHKNATKTMHIGLIMNLTGIESILEKFMHLIKTYTCVR